MRCARLASSRHRWPEFLEERRLLATLIAVVDSGIDLADAASAPYIDYTHAYDAFGQQTVAANGTQVVQDTSLQHGHGASVVDWIIRGIKDTKAQPGAAGADVKILPIRDTSSGLSIDSNALIRGIYWAADHGASVINLSMNSTSDSVLRDPSDPRNGTFLSQAIQYAETKGAVVVTAPGNSAMNIDRSVLFPAYADDAFYSHASPLPTNLLVAAGVDPTGKLTGPSSWGPVHVDVGAYTSSEGYTSYSAAYASGVSGVIAALLPTGHTAKDVIDVISTTVTPQAQSVGAWSRTGGVIDPAAAVASIPRAQPSVLAIDAGGPAVGNFAADAYAIGGQTYISYTLIDTGGVTDPAPVRAYQTERHGNFTYTIPKLTPGNPYQVRLDFAEIYWSGPGQRLFDVVINGNQVLTGFDVYSAAGGMNKAVAREFLARADASGRIAIQFTGVVDKAKVSAIRIIQATDRAVGRPTYASSIEGLAYDPELAVDGSGSTRWSSGQWMQGSQTGWIIVDLGAPYSVSDVRLDWEAAYAVDYQIQLSDDNTNWTTIQTVTGNQTPGPADFAGLSGTGRYLRVYSTCTSTGSNNYSLYDIDVFGVPVVDLALGKPAFASSTEGPAFSPDRALDGNGSTRWSSGQWLQSSPTGWIAVDLGSLSSISRVHLNWEKAYAVDYQIQVSNDAQTWTPIQNVSGNQSNGPADFSGLSGIGRYLRVHATKTSAGSNNFSLFDLNVYGTPLVDLARGRPVTSSTIEGPNFSPALAVDGASSTRWSSGQWMQNSQTGWISVDLGARYSVCDIRLDWEAAYAVDYQIQLSDDNANWTSIQTVTGNQSWGPVDLAGLSGVGRFLRIFATKTSAASTNYSLYDLEVFGLPATSSAKAQAGLPITPALQTASEASPASVTAAASSATARINQIPSKMGQIDGRRLSVFRLTKSGRHPAKGTGTTHPGRTRNPAKAQMRYVQVRKAALEQPAGGGKTNA